MRAGHLLGLAPLALTALACDSCYGPQNNVVLTRNVRRMQPDAENATVLPRGPLEWGQINFLHTTDTHGWLEGHIKEQNYGADWGDFVSFTKHMKKKAKDMDVDLLLVDTGDLHDGAGLSDATSPDGAFSNPVFENIDYDLLTIGNHELYVSEVSYETFNGFAKVYGDRYLTSNVEILNPATGKFESLGAKYRYFTTEHGLRIMSFGVIFDFTGNSNASRITKAKDMVKQPWFLSAVNFTEPIDLFVLLGHNPPRTTAPTSTWGTIYSTIRKMRPDVPIQVFGGHTHVRDFVVYDTLGTGLESGRYCESLGWLSMSGINSTAFTGTQKPHGVPHPTTKPIAVNTTASANISGAATQDYGLKFSRRYLDWNRLTFTYHAAGSQKRAFDTPAGLRTTGEISAMRQQLNLTGLYGCAPQTYCQYCKPFGDPGNIYTLLTDALAATVVNQSRADVPRLVSTNTGSVRFDLAKGPFTYDDSFIVSPFINKFYYIPDVPYKFASQMLDLLNSGPYQKRDALTGTPEYGAMPKRDSCVDPPITHNHLESRSYPGGKLLRRQELTPGYTTTDDFGTNGDDTIHSVIPYYDVPIDFQANASFPTDGSEPETVDYVFTDFMLKFVLSAFQQLGANYTTSDVTYYMPQSFSTQTYLPEYAKTHWHKNMPNCPVGAGIGFSN
ncbi:calcineurin-like phosphoesterase [Xylona heveae TC161]|uniref:Calcineurin-like phosphoesterase n=1 Tax=Xylona heveae (strain CBS 132557 / TC161) TaxID=1328760 RepID=A0A161TQB4_XYLHT|nr:calcineurin-like phosphoesterase [Xylona heveae TC161]KZF24516.1 calcineurin-like phosphoesterase [Xylona heveae TC161]